MKFLTRKYVIIAVILVSSLIGMAQLSNYHDIQLRDNQLYFRKVFLNIAERYAEEVNLSELINISIKTLVDHLDPYSEYIEKDAKSTLQLITEGTYGGLGMEIGMRDEKVTVISPIDDTPAQRAGIRAGDVLKEVDGENIKGLSLNEVSSRLRGKVGTKVSLTILRPGLNEPLTFNLTRAKIVLKDVAYSGMVKPGIGYVKLTGFTEKAPDELTAAIQELMKQDSLEAFILDLRNNPGGLLSSAVAISNIFIPEGNVIVKTKGKNEPERVYKALQKPLLPNVPLVILVDKGSASASEIVTGAVQDLDRGIIVGDTTYGKGLVQKIIPIDDLGEKQLKLTTAKYYTPSGRCIQREDYKLKYKNVYQIENSDSILQHSWFKTSGGRKVWSNGGIIPDIVVERESLHPYIYQLWGKGVYFTFVIEYLTSHPEFRNDITRINEDNLFNEFLNYLEKSNNFYISEEQLELERLLSQLEERTDIGNQPVAKVKSLIDMVKEKDKKIALTLKNDLIWALKIELSNNVNNKTLRYHLTQQKDLQFQKALELLEEKSKYEVVLGN